MCTTGNPNEKVEKGFIAQTGDPTGVGKNGDSIYGMLYGPQARHFKDEITPQLKHTSVGVVAMSNSVKDENDSRFYITLAANLDYLDGKHTIFGQVAEGLEVRLGRGAEGAARRGEKGLDWIRICSF